MVEVVKEAFLFMESLRSFSEWSAVFFRVFLSLVFLEALPAILQNEKLSLFHFCIGFAHPFL